MDYLKTPPSAAELKTILKKLGLRPRDLMRKGEPLYAELGLKDRDLDDDALIALMVANPILIERPIVVSGGKAAIGRPPESRARDSRRASRSSSVGERRSPARSMTKLRGCAN